MTATTDIITAGPHIPVSRLRELAASFQLRAGDLRRWDEAEKRGQDVALGLDMAAESLLTLCREMEEDEEDDVALPTHFPRVERPVEFDGRLS